MPYLKLPYPKLDSLRRIVDPDDVNANFREIARLVNGNLGIENLAGGRGVDSGMLEHPRSIQAVSLSIETAGGTWPSDAVLMKLRSDARLVGIGFNRAYNLVGTLDVGATTVATISTPLAVAWFTDAIDNPDIAASSELTLDITSGTCDGITLWLTFDHSS